MFDPKQHPRDMDGKFRATVYATPNRTYDSRQSCEDKFRQFEQDVELYHPDRQSNSVGVWDADMERSRTYEFDRFTEQDWNDLQEDVQGLCDTWAQDSILITRDNPNGESTRYTFDGVDAATSAEAFARLSDSDPHQGEEGYYGFGGTYRDGTIEVIKIDDDPFTEDNAQRLSDVLSHMQHRPIKPATTPCDAKLIFNSNPERQHRIDEQEQQHFTATGAIQPGSGNQSTDPAFANTTKQMQQWADGQYN